MAQLTDGRVHFRSEEIIEFRGTCSADTIARVCVNDPRLYTQVYCNGSLGFAESYARGYWDCANLVSLLRFVARDRELLAQFERGPVAILGPFRSLKRWLARNTIAGSKRNIAAHYDLSNQFFALFLDSTLTYSAGIFDEPTSSLEDASIAKYDRLCRLLDLQPSDRLLEIGTGWGGFACYAAREYGCHITTTTISEAQYTYSQQQFEAARLAGNIKLLKLDYRELVGKFDKIVSVEMLEAVGHDFLPTFFGKCDALLKPGGRLALQVITMPEQRYEKYRRSIDFIQEYVFPGGCLPSNSAILNATMRTQLLLTELGEFGTHYARTLAEWRLRFHENLAAIRALGMPERLLRIWHYYFCYCEAAFLEQLIGLKQMLFVKPTRNTLC